MWKNGLRKKNDRGLVSKDDHPAGARSPIANIQTLKFLVMFLVLILFASACDGGVDTSLPNCDAPLVVTTNIDTNDGFCNSQCTLREAIIAANDLCSGQPNTIELAYDTYSLMIRGPGNERGDLNITDDLVIIGVTRGTLGDTSRIGNSEDWIYRIFEIAEGVNVEMSDLNIFGGDVTDGNGGGILNHGNLTLERVTLRDNVADRGGGLFNNGQVILRDVVVKNNQAIIPFPGDYLNHNVPDDSTTDDCGGGINNSGSMEVYFSQITLNNAKLGAGICNTAGSSLTIEHSVIDRNGQASYVDTYSGGGIATFSNLTLSNTLISQNNAVAGGGIFAYMPEGGDLILNNVTVSEHRLDSRFWKPEIMKGGGIYIYDGHYEITESLIDHNVGGDGAGLFITGESYGTITNSAIVYNNAGRPVPGGRGGGIYYYPFGEYRGRNKITNVTISNNDASGAGGGIWSEGSLYLTNVTLTQNNNSNIVAEGTINLKNSLIAQSFGYSNCRFERYGAVYSEGNNISEDNSCNLDAPSDLTDVTEAELQLSSFLSTWGSSTANYIHLFDVSSVIVDKIPPEECPPPSDDQTGYERPNGIECDVGAIEWRGRLAETSASEPIMSTPPAPPATPMEPQGSAMIVDSLCWEGPGTPFEVVSNITQGTTVELLGMGDLIGWLVITNPRYNVPCWVPENTVDVDPQIDKSDLVVIVVPYYEPPTEAEDSSPDSPAPQLESPVAPSKLAANTTICNSSDYAVTIQWKDNANNETGYRVYRDGTNIANLEAGSTSYIDNPSYSGPHTYNVEAYNSAGSAISSSVQDQGCVY